MIEFQSKYEPSSDQIELEKIFNNLIESKLNNESIKFAHTEAALSWIVRGSIDYFFKLDSKFLGDGNVSGTPSAKADCFANNFYRMYNTIHYLCKLWNIESEKDEDLLFLKDIRTLIVHSGEQLNNIDSLKLKDYKDVQLGRILPKHSIRVFQKNDYDYCIQIWADKHDKKKRQENNLSHDEENENYKTIDIYINSNDVKNTILFHIEQFIKKASNIEVSNKSHKQLPKQLKKQIVEEQDFEKLENLIKNKKRGGYIVENGIVYWYGFGLKRLKEYVASNIDIPQEVSNEINTVISKRIEEFYTAYNNSVPDYDLPSLDVRDVFRDYTPNYKKKGYYEGQKLFDYIAPSFNQKHSSDLSDIDYLLKFVCVVNDELNTNLNMENTANGIICDYFVKSVQMKIMKGSTL